MSTTIPSISTLFPYTAYEKELLCTAEKAKNMHQVMLDRVSSLGYKKNNIKYWSAYYVEYQKAIRMAYKIDRPLPAVADRIYTILGIKQCQEFNIQTVKEKIKKEEEVSNIVAITMGGIPVISEVDKIEIVALRKLNQSMLKNKSE